MQNGEVKLQELFGQRRIFHIPEYQRAYAWEDIQLKDFIRDIEQIREGKEYYFGTVLFEDKGTKGAYEIIDVVDGQQRITTVVIFMARLIHYLNNLPISKKDEVELFYETYVKSRGRNKLSILEEDNNYFHDYIIGEDDGSEYIETPSQRRLHDAKKYFDDYFAGKSEISLITLANKIDQNIRLLVYAVKDTAQATLIFETTNDRGKGLTDIEKIKSFLMYQCYLASEEKPDELLSSIRARFGEMYRKLDKIANLNEDSILQHHFIAHFPKWKDKEYQRNGAHIKKHLRGLVDKNKDEGAVSFIDNYSKELLETFKTVKNMESSKITSFFELIALNRMGNFWPLLIKTYKLDNSLDKEKFTNTCNLLSIFIFRVYAVHERRANTGQSKFYSYARDFKGDFDKLHGKIRDIIREYSSHKKFKKELKLPDVYEWMASRDRNYFYWKYENYLRTIQPKAPPMSIEDLTSKDTKLKLTIEHIACQNPKESVVKNNGFLPELSDEFKENYLHSIGNLTIDPKSANSSKGRKEFKIKDNDYFQKAPLKSQTELRDFVIEEKWSHKSIKKRRKKLMEFADKTWVEPVLND